MSVLLCLLVWVAPWATAQEGPEKLEDEERVSWYVIPNAGADTDDGFGAGGRAEIAWLDPAFDPYRTSLVLQGYIAVSGYQHHRFRLDALGIGPKRKTRVTLHVAWRQWLNDGYWGIGNGTVREAEFAGFFPRSDPRFRRYRYRLYQPFVHLTVRWDVQPGGPWQLFWALNPKYSVVVPYDDSLLAEQQPFGTEGGPTVQAFAGLLHDTRDPEIAPERGHLAELSGRYAPDLGGEAGGFGGALLSLRGYASAGDRVVLAGRLLVEHLLGTVPFYEMVHWGGAIPIAGFGGPETLRAASFGRWRAPGKGVVNTELRWRVAEPVIGTASVGLELAPYVDLGTVWGADAPVPLAPIPVHPVVGGGIRVIYDETFVGRVDSGVGIDPVVLPDGTVEQRPTWGFYLAFDHPF